MWLGYNMKLTLCIDLFIFFLGACGTVLSFQDRDARDFLVLVGSKYCYQTFHISTPARSLRNKKDCFHLSKSMPSG